MTNVPELRVHPTSPALSPDQQARLTKQWRLFWSERRRGRSMARPRKEGPQLPQGTLIHNTHFEAERIQSILDSGILAGDVGHTGREPGAEDMETFNCADFFVVDSDRSIAEHTEFVYTPQSSSPGSSLRMKPMESYSAPNARNWCVSFIVDPTTLGVQAFLNESSRGDQKETSALQDWPMRFPHGGEKGKRLQAVLVGIPSTYISGMVIGGGLASDAEKVNALHGLVKQSGLNIPIFDTGGHELTGRTNSLRTMPGTTGVNL